MLGRDKIAVVGGGIGGLASALFMSRLGYQITISEQAKTAGPVGAGFLLQPPGQQVLDILGVLDDISASAVPITRLHSQTRSGRDVLDLHYPDLAGEARHGLGIQRTTIYDALYNAAVNTEGIEIKWDCQIEQIQSRGDGVFVHVGEAEETYEFCVIASGTNSVLPNKLFPDRISRPYPWGCTWSSIRLPETLAPNTLHQRCQRADRMMGILPVLDCNGHYEAALYWSTKFSQSGIQAPQDASQLKREMIAFWPEAEASIAPLKDSEFISARYRDVWTSKPFQDRVIAIGDAAHGTSPQLGQGCTMALLDAWLLSEFLAEYRESPKDGFTAWWKARKHQLLYVRHLSRMLTPLYQSDHRSFSWFRDAILAPMGRLPWFYRLQLKTLASEVLLYKNK